MPLNTNFYVSVLKTKLLPTMKMTLVLVLFLFVAQSCISVAAYEKMYLNDSDMALEDEGVQSFETNFQAYREAASGANGGTTGGGCGCN